MRKWVRQYRDDPAHAFPGAGQVKPEQAEIAQLKKEVRKLKAERDILKSRDLLRKGLVVKFEFVAKHRGIWPVTWMCGVLDVSPSGFYSWRSRPPSDRTQYDEILIRDIRRSFADSGETYGVRRIWLDLLDWPQHRQRAWSPAVRSLKLLAQPKRRKRPVDRGERLKSAIAPNTLGRKFTGTAPNQKWVADFTYVWTSEGWLYAAADLDLHSRRIVGWSMKARMTADLVTDALFMAIWRRRPDLELLHHQGSQYTYEQFQKLLSAQGIRVQHEPPGRVPWQRCDGELLVQDEG